MIVVHVGGPTKGDKVESHGLAGITTEVALQSFDSVISSSKPPMENLRNGIRSFHLVDFCFLQKDMSMTSVVGSLPKRGFGSFLSNPN